MKLIQICLILRADHRAVLICLDICWLPVAALTQLSSVISGDHAGGGGGGCCAAWQPAVSPLTDLNTALRGPGHSGRRQGTSLSLSLWWAESLNPSQVARQPADSEIMVVIISYYTRYPPSSLLLDQPRIYTIKSITGSRLSLAGDNTSLLALLWRPERQAGSRKFKITELQPVRSGQVQH